MRDEDMHDPCRCVSTQVLAICFALGNIQRRKVKRLSSALLWRFSRFARGPISSGAKRLQQRRRTMGSLQIVRLPTVAGLREC